MGPLSQHTVTTYRYLRLGMVVLVVLLAAAILVEHWSAPGCWQTSISGYYYTPARPVLVSSLVAIGVCLVVIKGNTESEDVLLNAAGMLAPLVAFVPTRDYVACWSAAPPSRDISADIGNNVVALFVAGGLALVLATAPAVTRARRGQGRAGHLLGIAVAWLLAVVALGWFSLSRPTFEAAAHYAAAVPLFACFVAVVVLEGWSFGRRRGSRLRYVNRYLGIAVLMVGATVAMLVAWLVLDWSHALLWVEGVLIAGFASFWLLQTHELWHEGVRSDAVER